MAAQHGLSELVKQLLKSEVEGGFGADALRGDIIN